MAETKSSKVMLGYSMQLNNLGAHCLRTGCNKHIPLQLFKESLDEKLRELAGTPSSLSTVQQNERISDVTRHYIQGASMPMMNQAPAHSAMMSSSAFFIYSRAISSSHVVVGEDPSRREQVTTTKMDISDATDQEEITSATVVESAAILFNLGLIHHLMSFSQDCSVDMVNAKKARVFYEMAFSLLNDVLNMESEIKNAGGLRVAIAILNNLGQINEAMGRHDQCKVFFNQLSHILCSTRVSVVLGDDSDEGMTSTNSSRLLAMNESDLAGVLSNIMYFHSTDLGPAPAA